MANEEHLAILKQGVEVWNKWTEENPEILFDLIGADLNRANLFGANLSYARLDRSYLYGANLTSANLTGANLTGANLKKVKLKNAQLSHANFGGASLKSADFDKSNLSHADLIDTNLSEADLSHADLHSTNLRNAVLRGSVLIGTDLSGANLIDADLGDANLSRATLNYTTLSGSKFSRAKLQDADFANAFMNTTIFADIDLSVAKGLDSVTHYGPSEISISTLYKSGGNIPEAFLRGCGLKNWEIENVKLYRPHLSSGQAIDILYKIIELRTNPAIQFYSCFISYSSKNNSFAENLHKHLQNIGVRCWFAPEDIKIGDKFRQRIDEAIRIHDKLLLILSEDSMASAWVEDEVESAMERERRENRLVLFPVRIDDAIEQSNTAWAASLRRVRHIGDFSKWKDHDSYSKAFERLLRDLKAESKV